MADEFSKLLEEAAAGKGRGIYCFEGDEYLTRSAARELAEALVPEKDRALNLIVVDASAGARELAQHLMTVAMFPAPKAIVVEGAEALDEEVDAEKELSRARDLWQGKRQRDGARRLLKLVRRAGWGPADVAYGSKGAQTVARWRKEIGAGPDDGDKGWLQELSAWAIAQKISAPPEEIDMLVRALDKGLPKQTHLILVAESIAARHPLARAIEAHGVRIVRKAERKRGIETLDISSLVAQELGPLKKRLAPDAERELKMRLGDDLRLIATELHKLAAYAGERPQISRADVEAIVAPVREEEFFALGEAVGDGDAGRCLQLFQDELRRKTNASGVALPFLGGVAAAVRKLLYDRCRYDAMGEAATARELGYDDYQRRLFPAVESECKEKKQKVPHPFGAWLNYKRARKRPRSHFRRGLVLCAEVDAAIKTGADPQLALERLLLEVCGR